MTLMKGLTFDRLAIRFDDIERVTFRGYRSTPATTAWGNGWALLPLSTGVTMTTFFPANRPRVMSATFPGLRNFGMFRYRLCVV